VPKGAKKGRMKNSRIHGQFMMQQIVKTTSYVIFFLWLALLVVVVGSQNPVATLADNISGVDEPQVLSWQFVAAT